MLLVKFGFIWPISFLEKMKMYKFTDRQTDDVRQVKTRAKMAFGQVNLKLGCNFQ